MGFDDEKSGKKSGGGLPDVAKRILLTGLGAIFMTEEGIRRSLGDMKMPKEAVGYFLYTILKQKDELLSLVGGELSKFLSKIKVHEEVQKALSGLQLHLDAKLTFDNKKGIQAHQPKIGVKKSHER